ncbi:hypothetical protein NUU61_006691 [Penicillium alfredii]|uniref:Uncharacterized protein n=1 Tax=Penicillium alfredii TaxID=1506179 RepID=A0A9W9F1H4_9EURO|nr:uncharacterized protein NUU61_006691 [Penicillium alfredii]KAJ5091821.1 hypothetical protein NUU61_006691 [Penicillium alfredii]
MGKRSRITVRDYADHVKFENFVCHWDPAGAWNRVYGGKKSNSMGFFVTENMKTSGEKPVCRVRVKRGSSVVLGFDMPGEDQPSNEDVARELKSQTSA